MLSRAPPRWCLAAHTHTTSGGGVPDGRDPCRGAGIPLARASGPHRPQPSRREGSSRKSLAPPNGQRISSRVAPRSSLTTR